MPDDQKATVAGVEGVGGGDRLRQCKHIRMGELEPFAVLRLRNVEPRSPGHHCVNMTIELCPYCAGHATAGVWDYEATGPLIR